MKYKKIDALTFITYFVIFFFVVTSIFDLTVTYSSIVFNGYDYFLEKEANKIFIWGMEKGFPLALNPSVLINFALPFILAYLYEKSRHKPRKWLVVASISLTCVLIILGAVHISGGLSWYY